MTHASLDGLPNEVIQQILYHVPSRQITALLQTSRKFNQLAHPLLWQHYCKIQFKYWESDHCIKEKFRNDIHKVDWKRIFIDRQLINRSTDDALESILSTQSGRIEKFEQVAKYGYDAKDTLLHHMNVGDEAEDVLARRFHSSDLLGYVHRAQAIKEWAKMINRQEISLEKALSAFDMFVLQGRKGDFDEISGRLDELARGISEKFAGIELGNPRQKAVTIAKYMRGNSFEGAKEADYHNLQNNFIGIALFDEDHPSMPLITVAIYCCVAERLGLDAQPCGYPYHVIAIIKPAPGLDLNGNLRPDGAEMDTMYMDPHRSDLEISIDNLRGQLRVLGAPQSSYNVSLDAASPANIAFRTSRNIINSVQIAHQTGPQYPVQQQRDHETPLSALPDVESAFYGALWASLLLGIPTNSNDLVARTENIKRFLPHLIQQVEIHFPTDISLIEQYVVPLIENFGDTGNLRELMRERRAMDLTPTQVKHRTKQATQSVQYQVGQVFRHIRYGYQAIITGWDVECGLSEQWMEQMHVHELSRGKNQSFYHALVEDKSVRYVAEENIEIIEPDIPWSLMQLAGRYFKRWDPLSHRFISNIKDEYPDD